MFKRQIWVIIVFCFATTLPLLASAGTHNSYFKTQNTNGDWHSAVLNTPRPGSTQFKMYFESTSLPCSWIEGADVRLHATNPYSTYFPYESTWADYNDNYHSMPYWPGVETISSTRLSNGEREYYYREATHYSGTGNDTVCGETVLRVGYKYWSNSNWYERQFMIQ